jgi:endonuclease/exonuclease/phosphatase family metal-dependent hydrolase
VFLQEVIGEHEHHARRFADWPAMPQYEYLADTMWKHCYGRNAVYPHGDHGNALLSRFPIRSYTNHNASVGKLEARGLLHCVLDLPASRLRCTRSASPRLARSASPPAVEAALRADRRAGAGGCAARRGR